ncbi:AAA family ATPase (plasmid) [Deinococcus taeanensis]|uniref:tyrosine-protein kinase domain-containing protein n=1 Tax=Deinococcus taeanensis TaxID=2737050 RepID=UPI001CDBF634|nr:tyrosine-protein kinase domain-containing protein [Deinococcus taeanensis]UBV44316.1 AAA family ATPase [Deinococcus taeanensis]
MNDRTSSDVIDLTRSLLALKRSAWAIVLCAVVVGAATYAYFKQQTPIFKASTMIVSTGNQTGNQTVNQTLVSAPPLPSGALQGALLNLEVLRDISAGLEKVTGLSPEARAALQRKLLSEAAAARSSTLRVAGDVDMYGNGIYTVSARHTDPRVAAQLANLATSALIAWDAQRGLVKVSSARRALEVQLRDTETRLKQLGPVGAAPTRDQLTLLDQQATRTNDLNNLRALERAVVGSLALVAQAVTPLKPVAPRPARNAAVAGLFALLAASALVLLRSSLSRMVSSDIDLRGLHLRLLGEVPRLRTVKKGQPVLAMMHRGKAADSVTFLASNIRGCLGQQPKTVMITSLLPGEGKSTLVAGLAGSFAAGGLRTLLVEADVRHPTQRGLWGLAAETAPWVNLPQAAPFPGEEARDLQAALRNPEAAQARRLTDHLHLVVTAPHDGTAARLPTEAFRAALHLWSQHYDVVLVDAPPALAISDPLEMASMVSGVLIVLEPGKANMSGVQRLLDTLELAGANVIGVAFNKIDPRHVATGYGYGYGYRSPGVPVGRA